jgi:hypothetical protein
MVILASVLWRIPCLPWPVYGVFLFLTICCAGVPPVSADSRTWKYLNELSEDERQNIDLRTDTPRDVTLPYLPAEPYPFTPPYTAEEMGIRSMEFICRAGICANRRLRFADAYGYISGENYCFESLCAA